MIKGDLKGGIDEVPRSEKMKEIKPHYLLDDTGKKAFVVLTVKEYEELLKIYTTLQ